MLSLALWLQLLTPFLDRPVTHAYAQQLKGDVVISVTFTEVKPLEVCFAAYPLDDEGFQRAPIEEHCSAPNNSVFAVEIWEGYSIEAVNFRVSVKYPDKTDNVYLVWRIDT